jgi:sodium/potassium/calcium exchanger 6
MFRSSKPKAPHWWPSHYLPTPFELWVTLFPTLYGWTEKTWWERLLGIVAAPSIFLLTVTLPVVETEPEQEEPDDDIPDLTLPSTTAGGRDQSYASTVPPILIEPDGEDQNNPNEGLVKGLVGQGAAAAAISNENLHQQNNAHETTPLLPPHPHGHRYSAPAILSPIERNITQSPDQMPADIKLPSAREWNRWLVILQIFVAPLFIALIFWAKMHMGEPRELLQPVLIALVSSLIMLAIILVTTTPTQPPAWRAGFCFVGFIVSITWISTIADEVVGVLKSIGVILNISDAILGLTIFAVGNSLGDLVADYTVAKLGFPVMALSACFGGPMLNILLGIGLSGTYLTIKHARKHQHKHPGKELKFKPYEIEVSRTLMISGATLLVTLLGLLIVVPLRRWKMDRFVGWCLIALWTVSTILNVVVEVFGVGSNL